MYEGVPAARDHGEGLGEWLESTGYGSRRFGWFLVFIAR